jgi:hypothetical protein
MKHTCYAQHPVSVCLVVFKIIKPKGWRERPLFCVTLYIHFLTNHAVKELMHNTCAYNPILNVTIFSCNVYTLRCCNVIVLSLHLVSFLIQKLG